MNPHCNNRGKYIFFDYTYYYTKLLTITVSHYYRHANCSQNQVAEHEGRFILLLSSMLAGVFRVIFEGI